MTVDCRGETYTLTLGDSTTFSRKHQSQTVHDFDLLYALLCQSPDEKIPVTLLETGALLDEEPEIRGKRVKRGAQLPATGRIASGLAVGGWASWSSARWSNASPTTCTRRRSSGACDRLGRSPVVPSPERGSNDGHGRHCFSFPRPGARRCRPLRAGTPGRQSVSAESAAWDTPEKQGEFLAPVFRPGRQGAAMYAPTRAFALRSAAPASARVRVARARCAFGDAEHGVAAGEGECEKRGRDQVAGPARNRADGQLPGVLACGDTEVGAVRRVRALARYVTERVEHDALAPDSDSVTFKAAWRKRGREGSHANPRCCEAARSV